MVKVNINFRYKSSVDDKYNIDMNWLKDNEKVVRVIRNYIFESVNGCTISNITENDGQLTGEIMTKDENNKEVQNIKENGYYINICNLPSNFNEAELKEAGDNDTLEVSKATFKKGITLTINHKKLKWKRSFKKRWDIYNGYKTRGWTDKCAKCERVHRGKHCDEKTTDTKDKTSSLLKKCNYVGIWEKDGEKYTKQYKDEDEKNESISDILQVKF
jgi:hypothetical protein